ncbi:MAG: SAM-dependent methyltransferase [Pseudorhodoplanes sp.]|nr:SAM-dependent methyltransferase [Pseudorhodoplanes sp.]
MAARAYEQALPPEQRKRLGQFFSGIRLGKLLAHMALRPESRALIDPMAGHGDLLDAAGDAATEAGSALSGLTELKSMNRPLRHAVVAWPK